MYRSKEKIEYAKDPWVNLESKWRQSYFLARRKQDCDEIINLRSQIFKLSKEAKVVQTLPLELQYELDLISDFVKAQNSHQKTHLNNDAE